jgi:hypothetical protein
MDKFYTRLGGILAATLLVSAAIARSGVKGELAFLMLFAAQMPMYALLSVGYAERALESRKG